MVHQSHEIWFKKLKTQLCVFFSGLSGKVYEGKKTISKDNEFLSLKIFFSKFLFVCLGQFYFLSIFNLPIDMLGIINTFKTKIYGHTFELNGIYGVFE